MNLRKDHYRLLVFTDLLKLKTPRVSGVGLPSRVARSEPRSVGSSAVARNVFA